MQRKRVHQSRPKTYVTSNVFSFLKLKIQKSLMLLKIHETQFHTIFTAYLDSILTLMTVWKIKGKIIRTAITVKYEHSELTVLTVLG